MRTNNLLRKSPTSSVVEGPPMFMKTIAVGPFEDVASCITGGTTVAIVREKVVSLYLGRVRRQVVDGALIWHIAFGEA